MHLNFERLRYLLQRSAAKECTREEMEELYDSIAAATDEDLHPLLEEVYNRIDPSIRVADIDWEAMFNRMTDQTSGISRPPVVSIQSRSIPGWFRYGAAALVVLAIGAAGYFLASPHTPHPIAQQPAPAAGDIAPGGNKATLTLSNGSRIILDSAATGVLAKQGNTNIVKQAGGGLAYRSLNGSAPETAVLYNTLTVPRGGQYRLTLPDGSQVWLNAASSLRYPTAFTGGERRVEITGEAYFNIAPNASAPFMVNAGGMEVQVLGTQFDVNAYEDEPFAKTTLVEGSVRVNRLTIAPGEQAQLTTGGGMTMRQDANVDNEVAWKEGQFTFEETDLEEIMRQAARWYDVTVEYKGNVDNRKFTADISRSRSLSTLLKALEATSNIHFIIDGRKLIVMP